MGIRLIIKIKYITLVCFVFFSWACKKSPDPEVDPCQRQSPPAPILFLIKYQGQTIVDSLLKQVKISYNKDGTITVVHDLFVYDTIQGSLSKGSIGSRTIVFNSGTLNLKNYLIEYGNNYKPDTLFCDAVMIKYESGKCVPTVQQVKFNGRIIVPESALSLKGIYIFNKSD